MSTSPPDRDPAVDDSITGGPVDGTPPGRQDRDRRRSGRGRRAGAALLAVLAVAALALYLVGYLVAGDKLPRNAEVAGVAVGGLDRRAAIEKLSTALQARVEQPIPVSVQGSSDTVNPADAGLSVDYDRSIDLAGGRSSADPRQVWRVLTGGRSSEAVLSVDRTKLGLAVASLAKEHDTQAKDATLRFSGATVQTTEAVEGVSLDQTVAADQLQRGYRAAGASADRGPIELRTRVTQPEVSNDDLAAVVEDFAKPAVAEPITVEAGKAGSFKLTPTMIGNAVTFEPRAGTLAPKLDGAKLYEQAKSVRSQVEGRKPKNATVALVDGKPTVVPAVDGTQVTPENLAKAVEPALAKSGADRRVRIQLDGAKAAFSTEDAKNLGITQVTGKFTTRFPYASYRNVNIGRAAELINGTLLKPGDVFSLNAIVGERTRANGFTVGNIISGGKFRLELGGGVSQSATTTFNAMFFAGLKDIQHQPHTLFIDRYPPGREATVAWPSLDLKFGNNTRYGVLVQAKVKKSTPSRQGSITVKMWSTPTFDKIESSSLRKSNFTSGRNVQDSSPGCQPMAPVQGFDVDYSRLFYRDGEVVKTEKFSWRYSPTDRVRCT